MLMIFSKAIYLLMLYKALIIDTSTKLHFQRSKIIGNLLASFVLLHQ